MEYWSESTSLNNPSEIELREALANEKISDGWIGQIQSSDTDYLHTMAMELVGGGLGFYLERRGPNPSEWYEGVTRDRPKALLAKPWWQFWGQNKQAYLFEREDMAESFCAFLQGESRPQLAIWESIPPSY